MVLVVNGTLHHGCIEGARFWVPENRVRVPFGFLLKELGRITVRISDHYYRSIGPFLELDPLKGDVGFL